MVHHLVCMYIYVYIYIYIYMCVCVCVCAYNIYIPGPPAVHQRLRMKLLALGHQLLLQRPQQRRVQQSHLQQAPQHGVGFGLAEEW